MGLWLILMGLLEMQSFSSKDIIQFLQQRLSALVIMVGKPNFKTIYGQSHCYVGFDQILLDRYIITIYHTKFILAVIFAG